MKRIIRRIFRIGFYLTAFFFISAILVFAISITPKWGDALLCIETHARNGESVHVSFPLSSLNTMMDVLPSDLALLCEELEISANEIAEELKTSKGIDLVHVRGRDEVRIYVKDGSIQEGFIKVQIKNTGKDHSKICVLVPKGFVSFSGKIVKWFGLSDRCIDWPDEIKRLRIVNPA